MYNTIIFIDVISVSVVYGFFVCIFVGIVIIFGCNVRYYIGLYVIVYCNRYIYYRVFCVVVWDVVESVVWGVRALSPYFPKHILHKPTKFLHKYNTILYTTIKSYNTIKFLIIIITDTIHSNNNRYKNIFFMV